MIDGGRDPDLDPDAPAEVGPDQDADPWRARPFTVTDGRTEPSTRLDLMTLVMASGAGGSTVSSDWLGIDHGPIFDLCRTAISVAEVAARRGLPITVAKILLADLVELGVLITRAPTAPVDTELTTLEAVRDGLRAL